MIFAASLPVAFAVPKAAPCGTLGAFLAVPEEWESVPATFSSVQCAYRGPGSGYPNVNVLVEPRGKGSQSSTSPEAEAAKVLVSYRSVGITDASLLQASPAPTLEGVEGGSLMTARYTLDEKPMVALVGLFDVADLRFIVTVLDRAEAYRVSKDEMRGILLSFSYDAEESSGRRIVPVEVNKETRSGVNLESWFIVTGGFLVIALALAVLLKMRAM